MDKPESTRQLKVAREIQRDLETDIARTIVAGDFRSGDTLVVDAKAGSFAFSREEAAKAK